MARTALGTNDYRAPAADLSYTVSRDVTYSGSLTVDVCKPTVSNRTAIIILHGGAWSSGSKDLPWYVRLGTLFAELGFATFTANYTLVGAGGYTSQTPIDDVLTLVSWVRTNAATYNVNSSRVVVLGISAGGHLALMAAITGEDGTTRPDAVVGWSPGTDLPALVGTNAESDVDAYLGVAYTGNEATWEAFSPVEIVDSNCCPLRIVGSDSEDTVTKNHLPVAQFDDMHTAAVAASVSSTKRVFSGSLHGIFDGIGDLHEALGVSGNANDIPATCAWIRATLGQDSTTSTRTAASGRAAASGRSAA
jgi:acetyl esterase/lipase